MMRFWKKVLVMTIVIAAVFAISKNHVFATGNCSCQSGTFGFGCNLVPGSSTCSGDTPYPSCQKNWVGFCQGCECKKDIDITGPTQSERKCECKGSTFTIFDCDITTERGMCEERASHYSYTATCKCVPKNTPKGIYENDVLYEIQKGSGFNIASLGGRLSTNAFCPGHSPTSVNPAIDTALGCIPIEPGKFIVWLLPFVFGIAGGIAFLIMVYSFILMTTSAGDPKKIQGAKETMTAAIVGLLLSVFSIFILRLITVNILKIPGIN